MQYISTRGLDEPCSFRQAVMEGLARDGGLYIPDAYPSVADDWQDWQGKSYVEVALEVMLPFVEPDLDRSTLLALLNKAYSRFDDPEVTPLRSMSFGGLLELYHGPTLAFKDVALQFLGELFEHFLSRDGSTMTIVGATSGDTGSAAIAGVRGRRGIEIFMLHPKGRVSPVQALQMTTVLDANVHNLAVLGDFDDCQRLVKTLFQDHAFKDRWHLGAVNSINWARILAQTVYYFWAALRWRAGGRTSPLRFVVPTGNFGDIFAGYVARRMGLPIESLVIATNRNDILYRTWKSGDYRPASTQPSLAPAMDIQVSSNFERLLFDATGRDAARVREAMACIQEQGFTLSESELAYVHRYFKAGRCDDSAILRTMKNVEQEDTVCVDPHTATAIDVLWQLELTPAIVLATAHPAKFPEAVQKALGRFPEEPPAIRRLRGMPTRVEELPADAQALKHYVEVSLSRRDD
jgi:threonine synthase